MTTETQAPDPAQKAELVDALEDALSVCRSVDRSKSRTVEHGGCTMHLQTAEWCAWLETEVGPKVEKALALVKSQAPEGAQARLSLEPTPEMVAAARAVFGAHVEDTDADYTRILRAALAAPAEDIADLRESAAMLNEIGVILRNNQDRFVGSHVEIVRQMCAALAAPAPQAPAWQPIETAPKERGGLVDIICNERRYAGCHYDRICDEYRHITACGVLIRLKGATHWMPISAAPQPKEPTNDR